MLFLLTQEVNVHIDGEQQHQDDVGEQVDVVEILEKHVPAHAEKAGHQFMPQKIFTFVSNLQQQKIVSFLRSV